MTNNSSPERANSPSTPQRGADAQAERLTAQLAQLTSAQRRHRIRVTVLFYGLLIIAALAVVFVVWRGRG